MLHCGYIDWVRVNQIEKKLFVLCLICDFSHFCSRSFRTCDVFVLFWRKVNYIAIKPAKWFGEKLHFKLVIVVISCIYVWCMCRLHIIMQVLPP